MEASSHALQKTLGRVDRLIEKGKSALGTWREPPRGMTSGTMSIRALSEWRVQSLVFLIDLLGAEHAYVTNFNKETDGRYKGHVNSGLGILDAVREDLHDGFIGV